MKTVREVLFDYALHEFDNVFIFQNGQYNDLHQYNLPDYADCECSEELKYREVFMVHFEHSHYDGNVCIIELRKEG